MRPTGRPTPSAPHGAARGSPTDDLAYVVNPGSVGLPAFTDDAPFPHAIATGYAAPA